MERDTRIAHAGRRIREYKGAVNPPVYRVSTVAFEHIEDFENRRGEMVYGRFGTPTTRAVCEAMSDLEGAAESFLCASGLNAITATILAYAKPGGHFLVSDSAYYPVRKFCDGLLKQLDVETEFYDPRISAEDLKAKFRPETFMLWLESPGSLTFEIQDTPALAAAARAAGIVSAIDNTWGASHYYLPLTLGVDISVVAGTKYQVGHSDAMMGVVCCNEATADAVRASVVGLGVCAGTEEAYLTHRGLRTLSVRLERHQKNGIEVARWLEARPEIARVLHPALESHPDHALWKRDFTGACGLFGAIVKAPSKEKLVAMIDGLALFGIGASWGGYESLILTGYPEKIRSATKWEADGFLIRLHIGLEDPKDLIADLEAGLARLA
ncbi:MAG: cystathionine beta-lyase [Marivibrio sp.]|uniref:cystathionine beta-lyase n=1 Tax=Marivibrio sp. TaxID=2039719 RepID=UPI0032F074FF